MKTSERILLDANILVHAADVSSPFQKRAKWIRGAGKRNEFIPCVCPQVLSEFYAVITTPKRIQTPLDRMTALREISLYYRSRYLNKIYPTARTLEIMLDLLARYDVTRQEVHDLHLVATMLSNGVKRICTLNTKDFEAYAEIDLLILQEFS